MSVTRTKRYVSANALTRGSFLLARRILDSGWRPDALVVLWRGGTPIGIVVHEFLSFKGVPTRQTVVPCSSYRGIGKRGKIRCDNLDGALSSIQPGQRVLLVDDIFDTGQTACHLAERLRERQAEVRIATLFWKPSRNQTACRPDYFVHRSEAWVVFPHELEGLTPVEIRRKDPYVYRLLRGAATARNS